MIYLQFKDLFYTGKKKKVEIREILNIWSASPLVHTLEVVKTYNAFR